MKVLMITGEYPPIGGGISDYVQLLAGALGDERVESIILSSAGTDADVKVDRWSWNLAPRIVHTVAEQACDLVHIQYQAGAFGMHPAINLLPRMINETPVVTTFHDLRVPYLFPKAGRVRFAAIKRMARWSDTVIVSNPVDAAILDAASIPATEIRLGPSLPGPNFTPTPARTVGFFGYPSHQKGFDLLVDALARFPVADRPRLVIIGRQPPDHGSHGFYAVAEVQEMAGKHGIDIEWTGYLAAQEAVNRMATTGVIAFPFPGGATLRSSALIAALRCGRPVVSVRPSPPGHVDALEDLPHLVLVQRPEPDLLVAAIATSLDQPSVHYDLPEPFRWSTIAREHRRLYANLMGD